MVRYKISFSNVEKEILENGSYRQSVKLSLMSLYSYIIKLHDESKNVISYSELLRRYNRNHNKLTLTTLKNRIAKLKELGLISFKAVNKLGYYINSYIANRFVDVQKDDQKLTAVLTTVWTAEKVPESIEIANVEEHEKKHNCQLVREESIDLDYNTKSVRNYEKNDSVKKALQVAGKLLLKFKVRSKFVSTLVLNKVRKYALSMGKDKMDVYISKIIEEAIEKNRESFRTTNFASKKKSVKATTFNNFDQRIYDCDKLEKALNGEIEIESMEEIYKGQDTTIAGNSKALKFNNFDQREYDYNDLERKLLGWDED